MNGNWWVQGKDRRKKKRKKNRRENIKKATLFLAMPPSHNSVSGVCWPCVVFAFCASRLSLFLLRPSAPVQGSYRVCVCVVRSGGFFVGHLNTPASSLSRCVCDARDVPGRKKNKTKHSTDEQRTTQTSLVLLRRADRVCVVEPRFISIYICERMCVGDWRVCCHP
jgi:hypothetical protein